MSATEVRNRLARLSERQMDELEEYLSLGLPLAAAINLAEQKQTGHHVTR